MTKPSILMAVRRKSVVNVSGKKQSNRHLHETLEMSSAPSLDPEEPSFPGWWRKSTFRESEHRAGADGLALP